MESDRDIDYCLDSETELKRREKQRKDLSLSLSPMNEIESNGMEFCPNPHTAFHYRRNKQVNFC